MILSEYLSAPVPNEPFFDVGGPPLTSYQTLKCLTPAVANSVSVLISISVIGFPSPFCIAICFPVFVSKTPIVWSTSIATATKTSPEGEKLKLWMPFFSFDLTENTISIVIAFQIKIKGLGPSSPVTIHFLSGWNAIEVTSSWCWIKCLWEWVHES